ncbi:MAG: hypothetical protein F6K14_16335 [Symploca sp. SIO2C1]|nr:hypothetical protein [Symploca sp. SIO2C1]
MMSEENVNPRKLKNQEEFFFTIKKDGNVTTKNAPTVSSSDKNINVFLNGILYNNNQQQLINGFSKSGVDYVKQLEGSFVIFLEQENQLAILTDKVNSKKAFYVLLDDIWYISNNIDALPKDQCSLSLDGLSCYLANGVMLNDLTLFQEIKSATRASIHTINNDQISITNYWDYYFNYASNSIAKEKDYQKELESLLVESIKRRYDTESNTAISLSGGYDCRSILGILREQLKASNVFCFSYAYLDNPKAGSDAAVSKTLAIKCGYTHQTIKSYKGDFMTHLTNNANDGKCLANFCDELDALETVKASNYLSDVFVGDQCFGWGDYVPLESPQEILDGVLITGSFGITWLGQYIAKDTYNKMRQSLAKLCNDLLEKVNGIVDLYDKRDYLYLDQRINHVLMPWRENFTSKTGIVHNPYLDGDILEFMKKMPPKLRQKKLLFRNTFGSMFPDLFAIEPATKQGDDVDLKEELHKHKDSLILHIQRTDSRLDDLISKKEIIHMLNRQGSLTQKFSLLAVSVLAMKAYNYLRKKSYFLDKILRVFFGSRLNQNGKFVNSEKLLLRLLLIRIYLSQTS